MTEQYIPKDLKERLERELQPGEQVEWLGIPAPRYFKPVTLPIFLIGVIWTTFIIFGIIGHTRQEGSLAFSLFWGIPFLVIGLMFLSAPIWSYRRTSKTIYAITNKRAMTIEVGGYSTTRSYPPDMLKHIYIKEKKDGMGDVIFLHQDQSDRTIGKKVVEFGFLHVRNPMKVESKLKKLAEQSAEADVE